MPHPFISVFIVLDAKVEEASNGHNIASDKKDSVLLQSCVLLAVLLSVGSLLGIAVVLQEIRYPTDRSIDTSLRAPTRIRERAAVHVPLSTDSDDDQVTSAELLKVSALTL